ncbi:transcriptional regulator [Bisbaumannia pacifica]|uniref:Transcriptional regulator n=1 Tax=Bisbaumannia pacifica TaxID=77098 RepID=A0A510XCQ8_9GAMM|nr:helix-turn-helix transcriptional regulator [Halomonas pacifica]GEK49198.1 transcriptional regulator [Halomonas pacifica]
MDIRFLRVKAGMTQKELGEACGLGQSTIGNYEAGIRTPSLEVAQKIIEVVQKRGVNVSIADLFTSSAAA